MAEVASRLPEVDRTLRRSAKAIGAPIERPSRIGIIFRTRPSSSRAPWSCPREVALSHGACTRPIEPPCERSAARFKPGGRTAPKLRSLSHPPDETPAAPSTHEYSLKSSLEDTVRARTEDQSCWIGIHRRPARTGSVNASSGPDYGCITPPIRRIHGVHTETVRRTSIALSIAACDPNATDARRDHRH